MHDGHPKTMSINSGEVDRTCCTGAERRSHDRSSQLAHRSKSGEEGCRCYILDNHQGGCGNKIPKWREAAAAAVSEV